jgi:hypothetical protein
MRILSLSFFSPGFSNLSKICSTKDHFHHKHLEKRPARFVVSACEPPQIVFLVFCLDLNMGTKLINGHFRIVRCSCVLCDSTWVDSRGFASNRGTPLLGSVHVSNLLRSLFPFDRIDCWSLLYSSSAFTMSLRKLARLFSADGRRVATLQQATRPKNQRERALCPTSFLDSTSLLRPARRYMHLLIQYLS